MEQRDLIKDQLEALGKALGKILSNFLGLKTAPTNNLVFEQTNRQLKSELDIDIKLILGFSQQQLTTYLLEKKIPPPYFEMLINYVIDLGKHAYALDKTKGRNIIKQAQKMFKILDTQSNTYSFERNQKEELIKKLLQNN
ncbi:MAG: hypothetical protein AB7O47_03370 [Flavobacteriales bacterium]